MALLLPTTSNPLDNPDHSFLHRVVAVDESAPEQSLAIGASGIATFAGGIQANGSVTVGANTIGYDVKFFGATNGKFMRWDKTLDRLEMRADIIMGGDNPSYRIYFADTAQSIWSQADESLNLEAAASINLYINKVHKIKISGSSIYPITTNSISLGIANKLYSAIYVNLDWTAANYEHVLIDSTGKILKMSAGVDGYIVDLNSTEVYISNGIITNLVEP